MYDFFFSRNLHKIDKLKKNKGLKKFPTTAPFYATESSISCGTTL